MDEVFVSINGAQQYHWRAVDRDGNVLDLLVWPRRDKRTTVKFLRKLLKGLMDVPRVVIPDKLAGDGAAPRKVLPSVEHRRHKGLNNRAEHSHQPTRERERRMRRFKVWGTRNASSPPTALSLRTSARAATASPPMSTVRPEPNASPPGEPSPAAPPQHASTYLFAPQ